MLLGPYGLGITLSADPHSPLYSKGALWKRGRNPKEQVELLPLPPFASASWAQAYKTSDEPPLISALNPGTDQHICVD